MAGKMQFAIFIYGDHTKVPVGYVVCHVNMCSSFARTNSTGAARSLQSAYTEGVFALLVKSVMSAGEKCLPFVAGDAELQGGCFNVFWEFGCRGMDIPWIHALVAKIGAGGAGVQSIGEVPLYQPNLVRPLTTSYSYVVGMLSSCCLLQLQRYMAALGSEGWTPPTLSSFGLRHDGDAL